MTDPPRLPSSQPSTVVADPGGPRWLRAMATALARAGLLRAYMTPVAPGRFAEAFIDRLPEPLAGPLRRESRRRAIPPCVDEGRVERIGTLAELTHVLSMRIGAPQSVWVRLRRRRREIFDRGVSGRLVPADAVVIAEVGAARRTLARARRLGAASILDYPIAHHEFAARILHQEARLQPAFAPTLQFRGLSPPAERHVEAEIAVADRVLVPSQLSRRAFVEAGVDDAKIVVAPFGVDLDRFSPIGRRSDGSRFRVLFVGQLTQRKGISYLIDGFSKAALPGSELVLLGRVIGSARPWAGAPGLRHISHVPYWELPGHYAASDVYVLPSLVEGFPQTALEAMACGLPVIVSENVFGPGVVTDGVDGYVVPIRDSDAIAERLRHLHEHRGDREQMGIAARRRAESFPWERYGDQVVATVRELL